MSMKHASALANECKKPRYDPALSDTEMRSKYILCDDYCEQEEVGLAIFFVASEMHCCVRTKRNYNLDDSHISFFNFEIVRGR